MSKGHLTILFAICLAGILLRMGYGLHLDEKTIFGDAEDYLVCSDNLLEGRGFSLEPLTTKKGHVGPVYPIFLAVLKGAGVDKIRTIRMVQAVLSSLLIPLVFLLGYRIEGPAVAWIAALVTGIYPYFIYWSSLISTEWLGMVGLTSTLLLLHFSLKRGRLPGFFFTGVTGALSALTRPPLLLVPFLLALGIFLVYPGRWKFGLRAGAVLVLGAVLTLAPWTYRNYRVFQKLIPVSVGTGTAVFQQGIHTQLFSDSEKERIIKEWFAKYYSHPATPQAELEGQGVLAAQGMKWIKGNPAAYLHRITYNIRRFWSFYPTQMSDHPDPRFRRIGLGSYGLLFPFMLFGMSLVFRDWRKLWFLLVPVIYLTVAHGLLFGMIRYRMPIEPILILMGAMGLTWTWRRFRLKFQAEGPDRNEERKESQGKNGH